LLSLRVMAHEKRRRLPAAEAQQRILDAAERRLVEVGPEGLRLAELAEELGISHPAILHHFGSREELVSAVVKRSLTALSQELLQGFAASIAQPETVKPDAVLERIAATLSDRGQARLIAWLILSGREPPELDANFRLRRVGDAVYAFLGTREQAKRLDAADSMFLVELVALALLGDAVFGERMRRLEGLPHHEQASHDFRKRLGLLIENFPAREAPAPTRAKATPRKRQKPK
jgi:AcrR family transcriptional regulator